MPVRTVGLRDVACWGDAVAAWTLQRIAFAALYFLSAAWFGTVGHSPDPALYARLSNIPWLNWWDTSHFIDIATGGYRSLDQSVFYPMYPYAERYLGRVIGGNYLIAGLIISNLACLLAMVVFRILAEEELDKRRARWALAYFTFNPVAVYLAVTYSESLFLLFAISAFLAIRRGLWLWSGPLIAAAILTRQVGLLLLAPLAVEAGRRLWQNRRVADILRAGIGMAVPVLSYGAFLAFLAVRFHSWRAPLEAERIYYTRYLDWPWVGSIQALGVALHGAAGARLNAAYDLSVTTLFGIATAVTVFAGRLPAAYSVYVVAGFVGLLALPMHNYPIGEDLNGLPRYLLTIFPIWIGLAGWSDSVWWKIALCAGLNLAGFVVTLFFFGHRPLLM